MCVNSTRTFTFGKFDEFRFTMGKNKINRVARNRKEGIENI